MNGIDFFYDKGPNLGFGASNNRNFLRASLGERDYFVVVNPDISFLPEQLYPLFQWIFEHPECSCVAPLIRLQSGDIQYSAKHNPTVLSLLLGRFPFLLNMKLLYRYNLWHKNMLLDYSKEFIVSTYLSGCFLIVPVWAYKSVGGFCERYFLHVEDADIVRRLSRVGLTLHNPLGFVIHGWARGSHFSFRQSLSLVKSFFVYCCIWGFKLF
ncbi:hypothetical protein SynWH8101_0245 [Synechococcus sp. WH 8101]|nr:hypothetical protein SynWH8101_0245 [Synechococcus sp. WH 8101]